MSSIIIPRKWQTQPQYPAEIDHSGRLFDPSKLSAVLNPAASPDHNLATGQILITSEAFSPSVTTLGKSYPFNTGNQYVIVAADADNVLDASSCTMLIATVRLNTTTTANPSHGYDSSASERAMVHMPFTDNNIYWDYGNSTAGSGRVSTSMASFIAAGTVNIWGFVAGSRGREIWRNGKLLVNNTSATATRGATNRSFRFGAADSVSGGKSPSEHTALFVLSKEQWSQAAIAELTTNPWTVFRRSPQVLYFDVGGAGAQTLTPSLVVYGETFHAATVSAGAVTLTPALYSDGDAFHASTVTLGGAAQDLTPSLFADGDTFHSATVAAGSVNLAPSLVTDGDSFHSATVAAGSVTLTPSLVSDGDTFYTHAVVLEGGPQTLSPDLFADGDAFHAATVTPGAVTLTPSLYTDPDTFHAAEVASGFNLQPPAYADPDTFYPATVAAGSVSLAPDLFVDGDAFHAPTVSLAGTQTLTPDLFADADTFYVPTLTGGAVILGAARSAGRQLQTGARSNIQTNRR